MILLRQNLCCVKTVNEGKDILTLGRFNDRHGLRDGTWKLRLASCPSCRRRGLLNDSLRCRLLLSLVLHLLGRGSDDGVEVFQVGLEVGLLFELLGADLALEHFQPALPVSSSQMSSQRAFPFELFSTD